jgi:Holliday junction resolvase RusA-like endonuclease
MRDYVLNTTFGPYVLDGNPTPLQRARHGNKKVFDPQKTQKLVHGISLRNQHGEQEPLQGALHLIAYFYFRIPQSNKHKAHDFHYKKPDSSNLLKYIEDISNNIIFKDDAQIAITQTYKLYDTEPRTEFYIATLEFGDSE